MLPPQLNVSRQVGKTGNKMGKRFEGICQRARTKVGDLGGRQQRLADGRSWICEESEDARRRRSQKRNSVALRNIFQAAAAFSPRSYWAGFSNMGGLTLALALDGVRAPCIASIGNPHTRSAEYQCLDESPRWRRADDARRVRWQTPHN